MKILILMTALTLFACGRTGVEEKTVNTLMPTFDESRATSLIRLSMSCVERKYPYKIGYRFQGEEWVKPHYEVHPSFYGCWDWHSAVHGHWSMVKVLKTFPEISVADSIRMKLSNNLSAENLDREYRFFAKEEFTKSFERTYGWAWLLKLYAELYTWDDAEGKQWLTAMEPLARILSQKTIEYLDVLSSPLRPGTHANTAFSFGLMMEYASAVGDAELEKAIREFSRKYFLPDVDCPTAYEPSGTDFLSPCLAEAALMGKLLEPGQYQSWLGEFLPPFSDKKFEPLTVPPLVLDREDPGIGHLIGLMFHRAWTMRQIAEALSENDERKQKLRELAVIHANRGYELMFDSGYGGEHWLATFAIYTLGETLRAN